ncbi:uncharacterized protein KY384_004494 [Bacidia gigantensis]|uniref:uncharacterized protein n=1 Tax=Bacidia gigantensis TaxID=2732470 RepID=UPI001D041CAC|nr:uncharacterized protein KY384_004494 [Bacidia gigantensis]KAG8531136.1 hypothetical protein KY384_004494 [Bacidia gigantensis]
MPQVEARLLRAGKTRSNFLGRYQLSSACPNGIPINSLEAMQDIVQSSTNHASDALEFLDGLLGGGSSWHGWKLHKLGPPKKDKNDCENFDFIVVREKDVLPNYEEANSSTRAASTMASDVAGKSVADK